MNTEDSTPQRRKNGNFCSSKRGKEDKKTDNLTCKL
jgi:hypothetical protein